MAKTSIENSTMKWILIPISEQLPKQKTEINQDVLVGRHANCGLVLQDAKISRKHAAFYHKEDGLWLEDLQSSNGTFINQSRVNQPTQLQGGEQIQFADLQFQLQFEPTTVVETPEPAVEVATQTHVPKQEVEKPHVSIESLVEKTPEQKVEKPQEQEIIEPVRHEQKQPERSSEPVAAEKSKTPLAIILMIIAFIVAIVLWSLFK